MKHIALILALTVTPLAAQEAEDEGIDLIEEGAQLLLRGLMQEMEPAIDDLRTMMENFGPAMEMFVAELGPALSKMLAQVDDLRNYDQPEFLPNGDIIIRRKPDAPEWTPDTAGPEGEIEL